MRFIENGPSIPDDLLNGRDEGRVVFFCGAGVSLARAGLPDFFGLAESVLQELGATDDSAARRLLTKAWEIGQDLHISGLISADRIFGLLEREFTIADIQVAVAKTLNPTLNADLSAHRILLRLATTPASKTQLVTTNFDRLFEACNCDLPVHQPPRLPNPSRYDDLNGIVYLHGRVNNGYSGADGSGFVLSSSDFGYAYLSEGWATEFFRDIVRSYIVVFVGYSADDPPIHYLLEGLRRIHDSSRRIYAFQAQESDEVVARWIHKGVEVIPYAHTDRHLALWETLEQWAQRADDPIAWRQTIIELAMRGPDQLQHHQRGQIAHLISTYDGARLFAESTPPAEWLCVLDPACRLANPERSKWLHPEKAIVDPFAVYSLDSDAFPERGNPDNPNLNRVSPTGTWDAFSTNNVDRLDVSDETVPSVRGHNATRMPRLPRRLECLGAWIANVSDQPTTVWWAARQKLMHPAIRQRIGGKIERLGDKVPPIILRAWRFLLEAWECNNEESRLDWYQLKRQIDRDGWSSVVLRRFTLASRPYLTAGPALMSDPVPPEPNCQLRLNELLKLDVVCPFPEDDLTIPDSWIEYVVRELRRNIELAAGLCEEIGDLQLYHISPIARDDSPHVSDYQRTHGLSGYVIRFTSLFDRLVDLDIRKAKREFFAWPLNGGAVFDRLRIWAGGNSKLVTATVFCQIVKGLSNDAFWDHYHQRDLLLALVGRWPTLSVRARKQVEKRLLDGPARWEGEVDSSYNERWAWATLQRLQWLSNNKCGFSFDLEQVISERRRAAPNWRPVNARRSAESRESRAGFVATNREYAALLQEPISSVLAKAREVSGRSEYNPFEDRNPFAGLCEARPVRAFLALSYAARQDNYPQWAWETFFNSSSRERDEPKVSAAIVGRICRVPDDVLIRMLHASSWWFRKVSKSLSQSLPQVFDKAVARFIDVLRRSPAESRSSVLESGKSRDWLLQAINSPVGHIAEAILEDSRLDSAISGVSISTNCLDRLQELLALTGDARRYAIAIIARNLGWFYGLVPEWTEINLLSILGVEEEEDRGALWAGYLWDPVQTSEGLYLRLKPSLLALAKGKELSRDGHVQSLAYLLALGWFHGSKPEQNRWLSSTEFRDVLLHVGDDFRSHILWQINRSLDDDNEKGRNEWNVMVLDFFRNVWPRQSSVKTPAMSVRLCELLLTDTESFAQLIEVVLPLLTKITSREGLHFHFRDEASAIASIHPQRVLSLLYLVLPDEVADWPYGTGDLLAKIGDADASLLSDSRLQELTRKWSAR